MKKLSLLFAMFVFVCANAFAQSMYFDFNDCPAGAKIAQTLGEPWTTWSNAPGGAEDGVFGEAGGSMAAHFTYGNDQVLRLGGIESGVFDLVFDAYVPNGKCGYFNVLHNFAGGGSTWAAQFYLCATNDGNDQTVVGEGHGTVHAGSNGTADIPCVWDQWMQYRVHIDMDNDVATLFWNIAGEPEQEICTWQWSLDSFGENTVGRTLDAMDFYPPSNGAEYYVDNIGIISGADDQVLINDDFEAYPLGGKIAESAQAIGNDWWTTWTNHPGGNEDGVIAEAGGTQCGYISGANDNVLLLGGQESGAYNLEFAIYCEAGKYGYFNILHEFNGSGSTWAMQAYLNATNDGSTSSTTYSVGHGTVHAGANSNGDIPAVVDEWMFFRIYVDCDLDIAQLYYYSETTHPEEQLIVEWQWSLDSFGENVVGRKMDAMDFFAPNSTLGCYYLDNFRYTRIGQETHASLEFDHEVVEAFLAEDDAASVSIEISNENGTSIGDWTGWIDFGTSTVTTGNHQINYDSEIGENSSLVGLNIEEPTLVEVGAMFPGSAYAGSAMGTKIVSAQYVFFTNSETSTIGIAPNTSVTFRIYSQGMYGQPGNVLAEKVVPYSTVVAGADDFITATFDTPVDLTGFNVWVTVEFTQAVDGYAMSFDRGVNSGFGDYYRTNGGGAFHRCAETFTTDYGNFHIRINTQGAPVPATWANLSKPEGSIAIGDTDEVDVNVNSIGLSEGDVKTADIYFITNDPENPMVIVPLTLTVGPEGVAESNVDAFEVYPNPATSMVTVKGDNLSSLAIYNVAGQLVRIVKLDSMINNIDMNVEAGVYFFSIYDNNGNSSVQRIVITK
ncbi:MAG: T9SS type A sorting domain-containing protein [Bacteroidales bacterium]|nr:T9SS type A sorting domain-containing protein [Bacteroidales bacterium]